ncbi:MAG TPA: Ig-like domain-containing protein, partial [Thermoplasmata archaeon]|nr:Ig-like domain-containing protein [Thermoplasmata archaeon]
GLVSELNADNSTDVGIHVDEGSTVKFEKAEVHSSSSTNHSIRVTGGARPLFTDSEIRNSRINDYHISGNSHATFINTKHAYAKGVVQDSSSLTVKNFLQYKAVDSRWSPLPRGFVEVKDNGTTVYSWQLKKGGGCGAGSVPCNDLMVDRVHRSSGMWENRTSISIIYLTWTFTASPGPIDDINMSKTHFEWLVGSGIAPPRVNWTAPDDLETNVSAGSPIRVSFTAAMNRTAVESSIGVSAPQFGGFKWTPDNKTVDFSVLPWLMPDTTYTVVLNATIAKDTLGFYLDGNRDGEAQGSPIDNYNFTFTTGAKPTLRVIGTNTAPENVSQGEAWVPMLTFDYIADPAPLLADKVDIEMHGDATEADVRDVSLWRDANGNARWDLGDRLLGATKFVSKKASFNTSTAVDPKRPEHFFVVLNISQDALIDALVGVQITSESSLSVTGANVAMPVKPLRSIQSRIVGDLLPPRVVAFVPVGSSVPVDTSMAVEFSEPMNWTATSASFVLIPAVPFSVNVSGNTVIIDPKVLLEPGTNYTLKVLGSAARDRAGNLLDGNRNGISEGSPNDDFSFSFRTAVPSTAVVRGIVVDDLGAPLAGAKVELQVIGTNTTRTNTTNSTGYFELRVGIAGTLSADLRIAKTTYVTQSFLGILIRGGEVSWRNATLPEEVGSVLITVQDDKGAPAAGATVELVGSNRTG